MIGGLSMLLTARHTRRWAAVAVGVAAIVTGTVTAGAKPIYPAADPDAFYAVPPDIQKRNPGDILGVRPMPALPIFPGATVTMVKFRSTNSMGKPIAATTTVLTPSGHRPDAPLLSYQPSTNGLGTRCAASRALYNADPGMTIREAPALNAVLVRGWSIAIPDHLGPNSAYGAARLGGQITLDGIRAVKRVPQLSVGRSRVAMLGYSGGGMATAWAAALASRYAPELDIVGAAAGGVPTNLVKMLEGIGFAPHPVFGLAMAAGIGLEREYPDRLPISEQMNPAGIDLRNRLANACTDEIIADGAGRSVRDVARSTSMINDKRARSVVEENSLELFDGVPRTPFYEWHASPDVLIPLDSIANTVRRYCRAGVRVQSDVSPSPDHLGAGLLGAPAAVDWINARFDGVPAPSNC